MVTILNDLIANICNADLAYTDKKVQIIRDRLQLGDMYLWAEWSEGNET